MGLTNICSKLAKMDCYNAGGGCCASNSDGTGTISVAEKTSEELCGYCFTGQPDTLEATLEGKLYMPNCGMYSVCYYVLLHVQRKVQSYTPAIHLIFNFSTFTI